MKINNQFFDFIKDGWNGRLSASKAFWLGFVLPNLILVGLLSVNSILTHYALAWYVLFVFTLDYLLLAWQLPSIWRCAKNTKYRLYLWFIRGCLVFRTIVMIVSLKALYICVYFIFTGAVFD